MTAKSIFLPLCVAVCSALTAPLFAQDASAAPDDHAATVQLIAVVNERSDPARIGPYAMTARVDFKSNSGAQKIGELRFYRDANRLRSEFQLGGYREIQVRDGSKLYIARSQPIPPVWANPLALPDRLWKIDVPPHAKLSGIKIKKQGNIEVQCFSIRDPRRHDGETRYCVDAQNKSLLETSTRFRTVRFSGFAGLGEGQLPTSIRIDEGDPKAHFAMRDVEIKQLIPQPETFAAPEHAREFETCDNIEGGEFTHRVEPAYPRDLAQGNRPTATIFIYGTIDKDGSFTDVHVFSPEGPAFEREGREAAAQWRFSPGMCDGHAVAAEKDMMITLSQSIR
jgi:hypothetical protein